MTQLVVKSATPADGTFSATGSTVLAELLAFQDALRAEYEARVAFDQDEEDVMILLWS